MFRGFCCKTGLAQRNTKYIYMIKRNNVKRSSSQPDSRADPKQASRKKFAHNNGKLVPVNGTQTVHRIADIFRLIAAHRSGGLRFVEIAELSHLERPTAHRILKTLVAEGMVFRDVTTKRYFLGPLLLELGQAASRQLNVRELCTPALRRLAELTGDTSFLFVRDGNDAVCIERIQGGYHIQTPFVPVGGRHPLGVSAGGLALLSALLDDEISEIVAANKSRLTHYGALTDKELTKLVKDAQRRKYALISEKAVAGVSAVGLPVYNQTDIPIAAFAVAATTDRMDNKRQKEIVPILRQQTEEASRMLQP